MSEVQNIVERLRPQAQYSRSLYDTTFHHGHHNHVFNHCIILVCQQCDLRCMVEAPTPASTQKQSIKNGILKKLVRVLKRWGQKIPTLLNKSRVVSVAASSDSSVTPSSIAVLQEQFICPNCRNEGLEDNTVTADDHPWQDLVSDPHFNPQSEWNL